MPVCPTSGVGKLSHGQSSSPGAKELLCVQEFHNPIPGEISTIYAQGPLDLPEGPCVVLPRLSDMQMGIQVSPARVEYVPGVLTLVEITSSLPIQLQAGQPIAQIISVPTEGPSALSSSSPQVAWVSQDISRSKPTREYLIEGKRVVGLLDTGADLSVIQPSDWDPRWPLVAAPQVWGVGGSTPSKQSGRPLEVSTLEGKHLGYISPACVNIDISLWGRDLLTLAGASLQLDE